MGPTVRERMCFACSSLSHGPHCWSSPNLSFWGQGGDLVEVKGLALDHMP